MLCIIQWALSLNHMVPLSPRRVELIYGMLRDLYLMYLKVVFTQTQRLTDKSRANFSAETVSGGVCI